MKFYEANLEAWCDNKNRIIDFEEYYDYCKWWEIYPKKVYNYTKDKNQDINKFRYCICMRINDEAKIYASFNKKILMEEKYNFSKYDIYLDVFEFGSITNSTKNLHLVIDYLIETAKYLGAKFIRISTKEDFSEFYKLLEDYLKLSKMEDCYLYEIEKPIIYEDLQYLKCYDEDVLSFEDICFLYSLRFVIKQDCFELRRGDNEVLTIDRRNGKMTLPSFIINQDGNQLYFDKKLYPFVKYLAENFELVKKHKLIINVKIDDLPFNFGMLGNERIIAFEDIRSDEQYFDILYKIRKKYSLKTLDIYTASVNMETYFHSGWKMSLNLDNELALSRLCLDIEGHSIYPPSNIKKANIEFNDKLNSIISFGVAIVEDNNPLSEIKIFFNDSKMYIKSKFDNIEKTYSINKDKYLNILKNAYFCNWKEEYYKKSSERKISWGVVLMFSNEKIIFKGTNDTPKIWNYFIEELLSGVLF